MSEDIISFLLNVSPSVKIQASVTDKVTMPLHVKQSQKITSVLNSRVVFTQKISVSVKFQQEL